jgi:hypothetical protein
MEEAVLTFIQTYRKDKQNCIECIGLDHSKIKGNKKIENNIK